MQKKIYIAVFSRFHGEMHFAKPLHSNECCVVGYSLSLPSNGSTCQNMYVCILY
jgi:hypothetical protein